MKHIIGMAKSYLDLRGSKTRNLELDFLLLALAVNKSRSPNADARGVLMVLDEKVWKRADGWRTKHGVANDVEVVLVKPTAAEVEILRVEKAANARGNAPGSKSEDASAAKSAAIAEGYLRAEIQKRFPGVCERQPGLPHLVCISWDFYGVVDNQRDSSC
jgi:hypothetical protein